MIQRYFITSFFLIVVLVVSCDDGIYDPRNLGEPIENELILAAENGNEAKVKKLMKHGYDVNARSDSGYSALDLAVEREHPDVVKILLDNGAKVNEPNRFGAFPINMAVAKENKKIARLLLKAGADADLPNDATTTARQRAKDKGLDDIVKLMKKYDRPNNP